MKNQRPSHKASTHQTVTEVFQLKTGKKTIRITTTEQKLSAHAGQATFWGFLTLRKVRELIAAVLPHRPTSPNARPPVETALGFIAGIIAGADKLAGMAQLRGDPVLPELLEIARLPSQSRLSRWLAIFDNAAQNLRSFRALWHWCMERLPIRPGGYTLDLDSTALLHEDGHQEGVKVGHTRLGLKPCLHPLLAALSEVKLVVQFWLRPGNTHCSNNVVGFTQELLSNLPRHLRLRLVRADSGFHYDPWLSLLEAKSLRYIVVADLTLRVQSLIQKQTRWQPTSVPGVELTEMLYESKYAARPRRMVIIRRQVDDERGGGKLLLSCPGYKYQAVLTNLPAHVGPLEVWREYNGRAGIECVIKELRNGFGLPGLCCKRFFATEAAHSLAIFTYNLVNLFCRHLGWLERVNISTLRYRLLGCAGIISRAQNRTTLKLGIPPPKQSWWNQIWEKLLSPFPNCNAVAQQP
jgi:Transposase DDE domain group 1